MASRVGSNVGQTREGAKKRNAVESYSLGQLFVYSWTYHITYGFNQKAVPDNDDFFSVLSVTSFCRSKSMQSILKQN